MNTYLQILITVSPVLYITKIHSITNPEMKMSLVTKSQITIYFQIRKPIIQMATLTPTTLIQRLAL